MDKEILTIYSQTFCLSKPKLFVSPIYLFPLKEELTVPPDVYFCKVLVYTLLLVLSLKVLCYYVVFLHVYNIVYK